MLRERLLLLWHACDNRRQLHGRRQGDGEAAVRVLMGVDGDRAAGGEPGGDDAV